MKMLSHSGHDYDLLRSRWEALVEDLHWKTTNLAAEGKYPILAFENEPVASDPEDGGIYLSAGIHGDECAPPWGLLAWAEARPKVIFSRPMVIFPCLNPHGLVENTRRDGEGIDLNRCFHDKAHPLIRAWQGFLEGRRFETALNLHEDYDTTGIYLYEVSRSRPSDGIPRGERFLSACDEIIPREASEQVDGSDFENGLLVHGNDIETVIEQKLDGGWPEAIYLYLHHARDCYTFETPSEMALERRVAAHRRFLEAATASV